MFAFIQDLSVGIAILLTLLCYVSGVGSVVWALALWLKKSRTRSGSGPGFGAILGIAFIGATLLSFAGYTNGLNAWFGGSGALSVGAPTQLRATLPDPSEAGQKDLATILSDYMKPIRFYFYVYGLVFLYIWVIKFRDRLSGTGRHTLAGCIIGCACSLGLMNSDVLVPGIVKAMGY